MTAEVERRIVEMQFENEQFEKGAKQSLSTLEKLDNFLDNMSAAGMDKISGALDELSYRFSAFGIAGAEAVRKVTDSMLGLAANMLRAIPEKIISGGLNRAFNLEDAEFRLNGLGVQWGSIQDDLEYAVNQTAYGLDEAAQAASILAGAQIDWTNNVEGASDMAHALRAISGVAAMTGSSYSDIAAVLTDVAAAGRVTGDVVTRLAYRGMNVTAALAKGMGKSQAEIQKMFDEGTLKVTDFYLAMDKAFGEHATDANKTYSGSLMNINAALSRIGADFIQPLHSNLIPINNALREMFNRLRDVTRPFAEGQWKSFMEAMSNKLLPIIESISFEKLKPVFDFIGKILDRIPKVVDKVTELIRSVKDFFTGGKLEATLSDPFKAFDEWDKFDGSQRLEKIRKIFAGIKRAVQMAGDAIKLFWKKANDATGGLFGKAVDYILNKLTKLSDWFLNNQGWIWMNITKFADGFGKVASFLVEIGTKVFRIGEKAFSVVWKVLTRVWNFLKESGAFKVLGDILSWVGDRAIEASGKLSEFLDKLLEMIETGETDGIFGFILGAFGDIGKFFENAIKKIKEFFGYFKIDIDKEKLFASLGKAGEFLSDIFRRIGKAFKETFAGAEGSGNEVAKALSAILTAFLSFRRIEKVKWAFDRIKNVFTMFKGGYKDLEDAANFPDRISTLIKRVNGAIRSFTTNMDIDSIKKAAEAVVILAIGLGILSLIPADKLEVAMGKVVTLMVMLAGIIVLLSDATVGNSMSLMAITPVLVAFGAAILLLAGALWIISKIDPERVHEAWAELTWTMMSIVAVFFLLTKIKPAKMLAAGAAILMVSAAMILVAIALAGLSFFNGDKVHAAWEQLSWTLLSMVAAIFLLSKVDPVRAIASAGALIIVAGSLVLVALSLSFLSVFNADRVHAAWEQLSWMLLSMVATLFLLSKVDPVRAIASAAAMILVSASLMAVALSLAFLSVFNADRVHAAWEQLSWMLLSMVATLFLLSKVNPLTALPSALGLVIVAGALFSVALVLMLMSQFNGQKMHEAWAELSWTLLSMVATLFLLSKVNPLKAIGSAAALLIASKAMYAVAITLAMLSIFNGDAMHAAWEQLTWTLMSIVASLFLLSGVSPVKLLLGAAALVIASVAIKMIASGIQGIAEALNSNEDAVYGAERVLIVLGLALAGLGAIGGQVMLGALALVVASASLLIAGPGIKSIGEALPYLADGLRAFEGINLQMIGAALGGAIVTALLGILGLPFLTFGAGGVAVLTALGEALPILAEGIAAFGQVSGWDLVKLLGGVATGVGSILAIKLAKNGVNDFYTVAVGLDMIAEACLKIPDDIGQILKDFAKGMEKGIPEITNALSDLNDFMIGKFQSETVRRNWITIGHNIVVGITNGINQNSYIAENAMTRLANSLQRQFTVRLSIHSPSRVFENLAEYIPAGIARGIQNGSQEVTNSLINSMSGAIGYMEELGKSSSEYAPYIRPVMDLSGMRSSMLYADQMLQTSSLGRMGNISGLNVNGDAISYNMQNKDVVIELQILEDKIVKLGQAIENMKLVMDTGMVVGALAPQMNSQLGTYAVRERRQ